MADMKILVVDDEIAIRHFLKYFLSFNGYHVDCASDGLEGLELIEDNSYDLVIVDYIMPKMDGLEFVKQVRRKWQSIPVFAMSGSQVKDQFLEAGADLFIQKPVKPEQLKKAIEAVAMRT
ncbi:MAG: response regulator transcription factor [Nitrospirota bacterium]